MMRVSRTGHQRGAVGNTRIMLAEDHVLVWRGKREMLDREEDIGAVV